MNPNFPQDHYVIETRKVSVVTYTQPRRWKTELRQYRQRRNLLLLSCLPVAIGAVITLIRQI